ncbi:MAG: hypothetical protein ABSG68_13710 [Thermoguttaceae bacterium]|jgi:hypothetical protein
MSYQPAAPAVNATSQVAFVGPEGTQVQWDVSGPGRFDSEPLTAPGRYNFPQAQIYRLKLTNVPGRAGVELYPSLEVAPALPRTEAFLEHNAIPVQLTEEDFDQVLSGNFVTKVIYLPDPEFQELALAGVETLVSTRLDPGVDPIVEAQRRGAILAIVRLGNKDLQIPNQGQVAEREIIQTGYEAPINGQPGTPYGISGVPMGMPVGAPTTMPTNFIAGVTAPQWGMPMVGTPIGLPGPPHIPLGVPAGLERHTMVNHTHNCIPEPEHNVRIDVKQTPGFTYPKPVNEVYIHEHAFGPGCLPSPCCAGGNCGPSNVVVCPPPAPAACPVAMPAPGANGCAVGQGGAPAGN